MIRSVNAVILTFNNKDMLCNLLKSLLNQTFPLARVIVVDNASADGTDKMISEMFADIDYIRLPKNTGSAGFARCFEEGIQNSDAVWAMDDDVLPELDALERLLAGFERLSKEHSMGAVRSVGAVHAESQPSILEVAPWRGTLFHVDMIRKIGLPRDDYVLYGEDLEYSLRMKRNGYACYWIPGSKCPEERQGKVEVSFLGKESRIHKDAFRHYYAFRNEICILLEYKEWKKLFLAFFYGVKLLAALGFVRIRNKRSILGAISLGMIHGVCGKTGLNPRYIPDVPDRLH